MRRKRFLALILLLTLVLSLLAVPVWAAEDGDETAVRVYRQVGEMLGRGLSVLVDVINPERIVIGSIFQRSANLLIEPMERVMKEECLPFSLAVCRVVPAELGDDIGNRAALSLAIALDE